jgi:hypothetical protein
MCEEQLRTDSDIEDGCSGSAERHTISSSFPIQFLMIPDRWHLMSLLRTYITGHYNVKACIQHRLIGSACTQYSVSLLQFHNIGIIYCLRSRHRQYNKTKIYTYILSTARHAIHFNISANALEIKQ